MGVGSFGVIPIPRMVNPSVVVSETWASYVASLNPLLWYRLRETSGDAADSGSLGLLGTVSGCTQNQAGKLGAAPEAYSWDAVDDVITTANHAGWANLTEQEYTFLCFPVSAGEGNAGRFTQTGGVTQARMAAATRTIRATIQYSGTSASSISTTTLAASTWQLVSFSYSESTDRLIHMYINGVEVSYSGAPTASVGTLTASASPLTWGNVSALTGTWDGLFDEMLLTAPLTTAQRNRLVSLSGV